jgi:hypothetical protein
MEYVVRNEYIDISILIRLSLSLRGKHILSQTEVFTMSNAQVAQVNINPLTVMSMCITALGKMLVTTAVKGDQVVDHAGNALVNLASSADHVTRAVDGRSEIYANAIIGNGDIAEREHTLKAKIRLMNLETQEASMSAAKTAASKPQRKTRGKAKVTPNVVK